MRVLTLVGHGELSRERLPRVTNNRREAPNTESRHPSVKINTELCYLSKNSFLGFMLQLYLLQQIFYFFMDNL